MYEQYLFTGSIIGAFMMFALWLSQVLGGQSDGRLRKRLSTPTRDLNIRLTSRQRFSLFIQNIGEAAARPFMPKNQEKQSAIRRKLGYAGIYAPSAIRMVQGFKLLCLGGGFAGGYLVGFVLNNIMLGLSLGGLLGYMLPSLWIKFRISTQQRGLDRALADAMDLMVVCVEAGLTVDAAMQRVGYELNLVHPRLAREFEITHMETRVGVARAESLRNLGSRTGNANLQSLATMLVQAERFGTSIADALRIHGESMRTTRQNAAEETAAKASVKLSFPVVLFIFPAVLIVLAGPAAIGLFRSALFTE